MRVQLVVPSRHPAKQLEAVKELLNRLAQRVARHVIGPRVSALTLGRDDRASAAGGQYGDKWVGIAAPSGNQEQICHLY